MTRTPATRRYDVVVVGGGWAGSMLAKELGEHGWEVLVLEAGNGGAETWAGYLDAVDTFRGAVAKVPNSAYRRNAAAPSPDVLDLAPNGMGFRAQGYLVQDGELPYGTDYLRALGGTAMHWMGVCLRMHPDDFATATRYGHGRDWPIDYADLEPYYTAAEREIGVAGDADEMRAFGIPTRPGYVFPMHPIPPTYIDAVFRRLDGTKLKDPVADAEFVLKVNTVPQGRNGTPNPAYEQGKSYRPDGAVGLPNYGERCVGNSSCTPICPVQAKWTPLRTQARFAASVEVATRCVVTRVLEGANGDVRGVEYRRYGDPAAPVSQVHTVEADVVVLAAHAIENARLLLASGIANSSDQVGRNLMDHPTMLTWALAARTDPLGGQVGPFRGPGHTSGWETFRLGDARRRRSGFRIEIGNWGWGWSAGAPMSNVAALLGVGGDPAGEIRPEQLFGPVLRNSLGDLIGRQLQLQFAIEQPADPDNRVRIDPRLRDALGNPRPILTYDLADSVKEGMRAAKAVSKQIYKAIGAHDHTDHAPHDGVAPLGHFRWHDDDFTYHGAGHGAGTHVMGDDPTTSVVDSYQRCWDHRNLYAVGCGSMPSVGTSNPSLTMAALALRSAEAVHRDLVALHRPVNIGPRRSVRDAELAVPIPRDAVGPTPEQRAAHTIDHTREAQS